MRVSPLVRYALLSCVTIAVIAWVPGAPFYADEGSGSAVQASVVTALLLAGLLARVRLFWYLAVVLDGLGLAVYALVGLVEIADGFDAFKPLVVTLLAALQIAVLFSQDFDDWLRRRAVATA